MSNTYEQLVAQIENIVSNLEELLTIQRGGESPVSMAEYLEQFGTDLDDHGGDAASAAWSALIDDWPLEIKVCGYRHLTEQWQTTHVEVLFCTGGPHIELTTRGGAVIGHWGGYVVTRNVSDDVCSFYENVAEQY